jgi:hypothetical protein
MACMLRPRTEGEAARPARGGSWNREGVGCEAADTVALFYFLPSFSFFFFVFFFVFVFVSGFLAEQLVQSD